MPSPNVCSVCGSRIKRGEGVCSLHRTDAEILLTHDQIEEWAREVIESDPRVADAARTIAPVLMSL